MKLLVIYNPHAGHNRARKLLSTAKGRFAGKNIEAEFLVTEYRHHGIELVRKIDFSLYDGIVAAGGDGTLFEVINGYYANRGEKRIPIGTGNAFARDLALETNDIAYMIGVFYQSLFLKTHKLEIEIDGLALEQDNIFVEISNTRYTSCSRMPAPGC